MTERPDQRANQRRLPGAEVAFKENHQPRMQGRRQQGAQALGRSLVGQGKNGGNIGAMHDPNSTLDEAALKEAIRHAGKELGFAAIGFARADTTGAAANLRDWLAAGCHGEMDYMARHAELRANPQLLHAGTVTVISAAVDYLPHGKIAGNPEQAAISRYAQGRDYHKVVRHRLQRLAETIGALAGPFIGTLGAFACYFYGRHTGSELWLHERIMAVELAANPLIVNLAHHHSVANGYWTEPHASVSRDFSHVLFTSNWGTTSAEDVDAYMVRLPPSLLP